MSNREMLLALADELTLGEQLLQGSINTLSDADIPPEDVSSARDEYCEFTTRVAGVAEAIELDSLKTLMAFIDTNVTMLAESPAQERLNPRAMELIQRWPAVLSEFMRHAGDAVEATGAAETLRAFLASPDWPWRVEAGQFERIIDEIRAFADVAPEPVEELPRPEPADVSVAIPGDVSPKLLHTFEQELPQGTAELSQRIQKLFDRESATVEDLTEARRVAHTLKGAANIVGVVGIANVTHNLEDILESLVDKNGLPSPELATVLTDAVDCLEIMAEAALGLSEAPPQALEVLENLQTWKQRFAREDFDDVEPITASPPEAAAGNDDAKKTEDKAAPVRQGSSMRVQGDVFDKLLDITGELSSANLLTRGQLKAATGNAEALIRHHQALRHHLSALQDLVFHQSLQRAQGTPSTGRAGAWDGAAAFDPLEMDQYNEFHSMANLCTELLDDVDGLSKSMAGELAEIRELLSQQEQLNKELDQSITAERLVPVQTILPRLQRSVRQTCRMVEKQAVLNVSGETLHMDNAILETVVDPLLHILRNAVDHGIEPVEERAAAGKPEEAEIWMSFERQGNNIVITCRDDGRGIDAAAVKRRALELGLIEPEQIVEEKDLYELILQPGFSTKADATQVSGRGVGMDVVAKKIGDLRGNLVISSEEGAGTEFIITLPQTLLKTHVVLLRSAEYVFGILSNSFEQIVHVDADGLIEHGGKQYIEFKDERYEVNDLRELLGIPPVPAARTARSKRRIAILSRDNDVRSASFIDEALGNGELFVKKTGRYVPRLAGIMGTVLTADGAAAPVFDLKELLRKPSRLVADYLQQHTDNPVSAVNVLIVDDSSSARRSLSQVARDAGYEVRTAIDGVEAVTLIEERRPDLVLTDLEMPKMNGLELTAHLRAADATRDLPIVMVTSRSTEKHKEQAMAMGVNRYVTKPFTNDDLVMELHQLLHESTAEAAGQREAQPG